MGFYMTAEKHEYDKIYSAPLGEPGVPRFDPAHGCFVVIRVNDGVKYIGLIEGVSRNMANNICKWINRR